MARKTTSPQERDAFLEEIKAEFDSRLERIAADPAQWVEFIETVAWFGARYSLGNQILLMQQADKRGIIPQFFLPYGNKDATSGWLREGRQVRKGETAFKIWAPVTRRPTEEEAREAEAKGYKVKRDGNGRPVKQIVSFQLASTFDVSQTDGAPFEIPTVQRIRRQHAIGGRTAELLTGDDPTGVYDDIIKLIMNEGYEFELAPPGSRYLRGANGVTVTGPDIRLVRVRDDVSPAQRVKTSIHELGHIRAEHATGTRLGEDLHRGRKETEAESIAHIVCKALGLDSQAYSDAYVLGWANGDMTLVKACAETILRVSKRILADLTPGEPTDAVDELALAAA